jgi:hypothetical protein
LASLFRRWRSTTSQIARRRPKHDERGSMPELAQNPGALQTAACSSANQTMELSDLAGRTLEQGVAIKTALT